MKKLGLRGGLFKGVLENVVIIAISLLTSSILALISRQNPITFYYEIFLGALGSLEGLSATLQITGILIATALSFSIAARAGLWNIGAEGQLYLGAVGALVTSFPAASLGVIVSPLAALAGGVLFGALWGLLPGVLKARFNVDEAVTTLLMYLISLFLVDYLVSGPYRDPRLIILETYQVPAITRLPSLTIGVDLGAGVVITIFAAILSQILLQRTRIGFEIRMLGGNSKTAEHMGLKRRRIIALIMFVAGGIAGLAGAVLVLGNTYYLADNFSPGFGFTGIAAGALAGNAPKYIIATSFFFAVLETGGRLVNASLGIPLTFVNIVAAQVIIVVLLRGFISRW